MFSLVSGISAFQGGLDGGKEVTGDGSATSDEAEEDGGEMSRVTRASLSAFLSLHLMGFERETASSSKLLAGL